jgi:hypothetical protein
MENINGNSEGNIQEKANGISENFGQEQAGINAGIVQGQNGGYVGGKIGEQTGYTGGFEQGQGGVAGGIIQEQNGYIGENLGEQAGFNGGIAQGKDGIVKEEAGCVEAVAQVQNGYVGGFVGNIINNQQNNNYAGGFISQQPQIQGINYDDVEETSSTLPVKQTFFGKLKAIVTGKATICLEISEKEQKVLTEIHDFLFQKMSIKGFFDILKIGNNKKEQ